MQATEEPERPSALLLLAGGGNIAVTHLPDRAFPGVHIQADTLHSLREQFALAARMLRDSAADAEAMEELDYAVAELDGFLDYYEQVLAAKGLRLPYYRPARHRLADRRRPGHPANWSGGGPGGSAGFPGRWSQNQTMAYGVISDETSHERLAVRVAGVVQGVGFRPFVYTLAHRLRLHGHVGNDTEGVFIEAEGPPARWTRSCPRWTWNARRWR